MNKNNEPIEHEHSKHGLFIPKWLMCREDIKFEDRAFIAYIITLQKNEHGVCFSKQATIGKAIGLDVRKVSMAIARLTKEDKGLTTGRRTARKNSYYKYQLISRQKTKLNGKPKEFTTYRADMSKGSPLWLIREESEGRVGFQDIRTNTTTNLKLKPQPQPQIKEIENEITFPKRATNQ